MAIEAGGSAPYAPPRTVIELMEGYRNRGLATPFTAEVLGRARVQDSLIPRTLQALRLLDLIDDAGNPTEQFAALKQARGSDEYKARLQTWIVAAYADVLQYWNPKSDSIDDLPEAFRGLKPEGQRSRMVTLMVGLCAYAGILPEDSKAVTKPSTGSKAPTRKPEGKGAPGKGSRTKGRAGGRSLSDVFKNELRDSALEYVDVPPGLIGLLRQIPKEGHAWTQETRDNFLNAFAAVLDFTVPIGAPGTGGDDVNEQGDA